MPLAGGKHLHAVYLRNGHHYHHHVPKGLGVFPVPWSLRLSWSLYLFLGRPMFLRPFGLYCSACFGSLFVPILCTCFKYIYIYISGLNFAALRAKKMNGTGCSVASFTVFQFTISAKYALGSSSSSLLRIFWNQRPFRYTLCSVLYLNHASL